ncbi:hypothetical protein BASA81_001346 [Batrachochytrium salamandrivorans]|nr:hypothetical protein BASA81_001346 [Batrachochytrium salamandrivorans]
MVQSSVHHACRTFVYFESPLRIAKTLERIALSLPPTATWTKDDGEDDGEGGAVPTSEAWGKALQCLLQANVSVSESAKQVAQVFGVNKKEAYKEALRIKAQ